MICKNKIIKVNDINEEDVLIFNKKENLYEKALFLDLEHYVYKHPICIGVFGVCFYSKIDNALIFTQFMIENEEEAHEIVHMAYNYLKHVKKDLGKKYLVTFSGNNDCIVIDYLFKEENIKLDIRKYFKHIDLQKVYEGHKGESIGLKKLEKIFEIQREGEPISGMNLAKTINKIIKKEDYFKNMPREKIQRILLYNEQDVVNLFHIYTNWNKYIKREL
ncbi:ribonuclease H-like domain-containing protein [Hathewaya histolytica]|uniref:Putative exonuclease n=1 Tax=Hathewaya histolytica TaxID=1498 RepID=A0A4U9R7G5_HATHI|nr:ribonuclease H-like domain-containing protein [Hathewaya histolytica]VTQ86591.1 putative exonuclease [Hathewaya histolytica]